jgi:anti-sigma factor RsiW
VTVAGSDVPSDDEILRYVDGAMSPNEREAFEARLADHDEAAARVAVVAEALQETGYGPVPTREAAAGGASSTAARFVFRLSEGVLTFLRGSALPHSLEPALAVRAQAPSQSPSFFEFVQRYPFDTGEIEAALALEAAPPHAVDVQIAVQQHGAPLDGVRVKLLRDGRPVDSAPTERGRCTFAGLRAARYELEIRKGGTEVGRFVLDIRGDGVA